MDPLLMEEIARMLRAEMREAFSKSVFPPSCVPAPEIQADNDVERFAAAGSDLVDNTFDALGGPHLRQGVVR
jgi:hypothetical protein